MKSLHIFSLVIIILVAALAPPESEALMFDRRPRPDADLSYYIYPFYISIPGIGSAQGIGTTATRMLDSEMDTTAIHLEGDFGIDLLMITDFPLFTPQLTLSPAYIRVTNAGMTQYERGRDSDPDRNYYLRAKELSVQGGELSLHLMEDQLEFYYMQADIFIQPDSVIDPDGNEWVTRLDTELTATASIIGFYIDDTDNRRDPRLGIRFKYERWTITQSDTSLGDGYQEDFSLASYFPIIPGTGILVWDLFYSQAIITRPGEVNPDDYQCPIGSPPECQVVVDALFEQRQEEVQKGNATSLGGMGRLRSYPQNRFYDSYTFFTGLEYRWYFNEGWTPFDYFLYKGVNTAFQLAFFHEMGQVGEDNDATLFEDFKTSTGVGIRAVLSDVVLRGDWATGKEGSQVTVFVGYPF